MHIDDEKLKSLDSIMVNSIEAQRKLSELSQTFTSIQMGAIQILDGSEIMSIAILAQRKLADLSKEITSTLYNTQNDLKLSQTDRGKLSAKLESVEPERQLYIVESSPTIDKRITGSVTSGNGLELEVYRPPTKKQRTEEFKFTPIESPLPKLQNSSVKAREINQFDAKRVYVGKIPFTTSEKDVEILFSRFGTITDLSLSKGSQRRFAYITFKEEYQSRNAIIELDGFSIGDERIIVQLAKPIGPRKCFNCQGSGHSENECRNSKQTIRHNSRVRYN